MKAEDTVMSDKQLMELAQVFPEDYGAPPYWWLRVNRRVAKEQASLSFKLGIKEVLDAIHYELDSNAFYVNPNEWQARLKDWGIE